MSDRDCWATPVSLIREVEAWLGEPFALDVCALEATRKCERWLGPGHPDPTRRDALVLGWRNLWGSGKGAVWCNPPYSDVGPWLARAMWVGEWKPAVCWVPVTTCTAAYHRYGVTAQYALTTEGRVTFDPPPGVVASSPSIDTWGLVWLPPSHPLWHDGATRIVRLGESTQTELEV